MNERNKSYGDKACLCNPYRNLDAVPVKDCPVHGWMTADWNGYRYELEKAQ